MMGTAIVCFVFVGLSLLPLVAIGRVDGDSMAKLMFATPFLGSATIWFLAGMLYLWLQRIRDAIDRHGVAIARLLEEIKEHGLDVRATNRKPSSPPQTQRHPLPVSDDEMPWLKPN